MVEVAVRELGAVVVSVDDIADEPPGSFELPGS
jgi:hypothetical protein